MRDGTLDLPICLADAVATGRDALLAIRHRTSGKANTSFSYGKEPQFL